MSFFDKVKRQKFLSFTVMLFTLSVGIVIGTLVQTGAKAAKEQVAAPDATPLTVPPPVATENEFTKIAKMLEPSVVNISSDYIPKQKETTSQPQRKANPRRRQQPQDDEDDDGSNGPSGGLQDFFNRFFGPNGPQQFQFGEPDEQPSSSLGSGVVVDRNGYILTNNHVVEKATRIRVKFMNDAQQYPATVIGTDVDTDLAVIHVDKKNLVAAKIGNSDALQVGDWSIAIGSPFGFQATMTAGIVSALGRNIDGDPKSSFQHFIQTDAAINPGNSGGPLANIRGEVIGINTMIASRSGGYQGIGFAMPINTGVKVYNEIIKAGHVTRGSIGIKFSENQDAEKNLSLLKVYGTDHGVFVNEVVKDGPSDKAGMKPQDVVVSINGKAVEKGQDLIDLVADSPVGSTIKVGVVRDKKPMTLSVVVGDRVKTFAEQYGGPKETPNEQESPSGISKLKFGMSVQNLRATDRQNLNYNGSGGVLVASTEPGSFADDIGLAKGDIIVELNREKVNSKEDLIRIQNSLKPGEPVAFQVMRQTQGTRGRGEWQPFFAAGTVPNQ
jgi:serine protease Do